MRRGKSSQPKVDRWVRRWSLGVSLSIRIVAEKFLPQICNWTNQGFLQNWSEQLQAAATACIPIVECCPLYSENLACCPSAQLTSPVMNKQLYTSLLYHYRIMNTVLVHYIVAATCIIHHIYYTRIFVVNASGTCDNMSVVEYVLNYIQGNTLLLLLLIVIIRLI